MYLAASFSNLPLHFFFSFLNDVTSKLPFRLFCRPERTGSWWNTKGDPEKGELENKGGVRGRCFLDVWYKHEIWWSRKLLQFWQDSRKCDKSIPCVAQMLQKSFRGSRFRIGDLKITFHNRLLSFVFFFFFFPMENWESCQGRVKVIIEDLNTENALPIKCNLSLL